MKLGTVKWFDEKKGFGWIARRDGQPDIYVHISGLVSKALSLKEGDEVSFQEATTPRGLRAIDVRVERRQPERLKLRRPYQTQRAD